MILALSIGLFVYGFHLILKGGEYKKVDAVMLWASLALVVWMIQYATKL